MAKSAVLLLTIGLAFGLWLGFNPQAHQQTIEKWDSVKSAYVKFVSDTRVKIQGLSSHNIITLHQGPASAPKTGPDVSSAWKQISTALAAAWNSVQRFFVNVTAKINSTR
jgi:hypothetical protein